MDKEIYFCLDIDSFKKAIDYVHTIGANWLNCCTAGFYAETENAINHGWKYIITGSMAHLSFDLLSLGYDIYLCYGDKRVKVEPHMDLSGIGEPCKDIRLAHNIFKIFRAGGFNQLLGIKND